jgi:PAS domain S-box-containing protein
MPARNLRHGRTDLSLDSRFRPAIQDGRQALFVLTQVHPEQQGVEVLPDAQAVSPAPAATLPLQDSLFRTLTEEAPQVIWYANAQGGLVYANRKWCALVGGKLEDWVGSKWLQAVHPQDREDLLDAWQRSVRKRENYSGVRRILSCDGSYHTMSYKARPVFNENGDVAFWVGIDTDISEIKATEAALRLSNDELAAFSYSVSHDLRSPLSAIDGFSRLLARHLGPQSSDTAQHYLARIEAGVGQMGRLIEDLLSLAQVSRTEFRNEVVDLSQLATQVMERHLGSPNGREVLVAIAPDLRARGDVRLIRVMLENLLGNAWKFTSRRVCAKISVGQLADVEGNPIFFVRDNGAGFDMAHVDKLFKTCQRLHSSAEFPGTGVGLATVHRIVTRHGGEVWVDAEPENGATFFFTLPGR